jgi:signal transduction histidine kinase
MQGLSRTSLRKTVTLHRRAKKTSSRLRANSPAADRREGNFDGLTHDLRNVLTSLELYSELLAAPGVLSPKYRHYAPELRMVSAASMRIMEKLERERLQADPLEFKALASKREMREDMMPGDLGREIRALRPLLAALVGPGVSLAIECLPCGGCTLLSGEDLVRILVNLVCNASEAMNGAGKIRITAQYGDGLSFVEGEPGRDFLPRSVVIAVQDNGPGIPEQIREQVFARGFSTRRQLESGQSAKHARAGNRGPKDRGLGLSIVRGLAESAGGVVRAVECTGRGARIEVEVPVTYGTYGMTQGCGLVAESN